jgi:hypothetical protein
LVHHPKQYDQRSLYSFNTPDFTSRPVDSHARTMGQQIESDQRTPTSVVAQ